jgi:hypothetical protein
MRLLTDYFDRSYVINLPSRRDRRLEMSEELGRLGAGFERGKVELFPGVRPSNRGEFPSIGARGCFMSHLRVLKNALAEGVSNVLIMEDDLAIDPRFPKVEGKIVDRLTSLPWGVVYVGHSASGLPESPDILVESAAPTLGAHFYGVSRAAMSDLVSLLDMIVLRPPGHPEGGPMHFDGAMWRFRVRHPGLTYFVTPSMGWQRSSRTDIGDNKWFDRMPGVRHAVAGFRRMQNNRRREHAADDLRFEQPGLGDVGGLDSVPLSDDPPFSKTG